MRELKYQADIISEKKFRVVFGNHSLRQEDLQEFNPHLLTQVHGSMVVEASLGHQEADGQWTDFPEKALVIKTADCLPIFIFDMGRIFALHAGWRGIKKRIVSRTLDMCRNPQSAKIYIGPHIQMNSFQLDRESAQGLLKEHDLKISRGLDESIARVSISQISHYHISLCALVSREARAYGAEPSYISPVDTFLSPYHNSYRRNRLNKQRNFSFIQLID